MHRFGKDEEVVIVVKAQFEKWGRADDDGLRAEKRSGFLGEFGRYPELGSEDPAELAQDGLTQDELMVRQNEVENVSAESARSERTDEDVRV